MLSLFFASRYIWLLLVMARRGKAALWSSGAVVRGYSPHSCWKGLGGQGTSYKSSNLTSNAGRERKSIFSLPFLAGHVHSIFLGTCTEAEPSLPLCRVWGNLECKGIIWLWHWACCSTLVLLYHTTGILTLGNLQKQRHYLQKNPH